MTSRGLVAEVMLYHTVDGQYFVPVEVDDSGERSSLVLGLKLTSDSRYRRTSLGCRNYHTETAVFETALSKTTLHLHHSKPEKEYY